MQNTDNEAGQESTRGYAAGGCTVAGACTVSCPVASTCKALCPDANSCTVSCPVASACKALCPDANSCTAPCPAACHFACNNRPLPPCPDLLLPGIYLRRRPSTDTVDIRGAGQ